MNSRNQSLDVLRGLAVMMVVGHHYRYYSFWTKHGGIGVDLFFVLSGYLISGLLFSEYQRTRTINVKRFLARRALKIYPAFYFMIVILLPFTYRAVTWADFTFMGAYFPLFWGHAWSLSVEEHFYILLPVALFLFRKNDFRWVPWTMPVLAAMCLVLRYRYAMTHSVYFGILETHLRIDSLFAGVTLSWFKHFRPEVFSLRRSWVAGLVGSVALIAALLISSPRFSMSAGLLLLAIGFSSLLLWALHHDWIGRLRPLAMLGRHSYSIYLWHWPIALVVGGAMKTSSFAFWIYVGTSVVVGIGMTAVIETPILAQRDRMFPSLRTSSSRAHSISVAQVQRRLAYEAKA